MKNSYFSFFFICLFSNVFFAQNSKEITKIRENSNLVVLDSLKNVFLLEDNLRHQRVNKFLSENVDFLPSFTKNHKTYKLYDVQNNELIFGETLNQGSSVTIKSNSLYSGGSLNLNIQGQGLKAGVWDGGSARVSHQEFPNDKVLNANNASYDSHATHVTGTVCAQGVVASSRGIAFNSSVDSYDWDDDISEMTNAASYGLLVSNHSYFIGSSTAKWIYGAYDFRARDFDILTFNAPYYLPVLAAGNDRNDFQDTVLGPYLNEKGGYNLIRGMANSKNVLTIGAVEGVSNYINPNSVVMSTFSSWGPTDDGRIKPDVVAKGVSVWSTNSNYDTSYSFSDGTSMAAPSVTGACLLLQQYYKNMRSDFMFSATLKGLILHTASEAGSFQGPDYSFGWGLVNTESAAKLIGNLSNNLSIIEQNTLITGNSYTKSIYSDGDKPIMASICWTERHATANSNNTNDPTNSNLINDLDIRIFKNGIEYFPWTLDPLNPSSSAIRTSDNFRDNFEKIEIDTPESGIYDIVVSHKGSLSSNKQNYSLIVSGVNQALLNNPNIDLSSKINLYPNPTNDFLNIEFSSDFSSDIKYEIYDICGKLILNSQLINNSIDVKNLQSGIYFVRFNLDSNYLVKKFIKN